MDFFSDCKSKEEAKSTYKRLCKCFHPDKGGEESLMIELKKQYDAWDPYFQRADAPHKFNFNITRNALDNVYENKITELNRIIYKLRQESELMRIHASFDKDAYNAESRKNRQLQDQLNQLNTQLEDKKRELMGERDKIRNMSLSEKIKNVFGYE